MAERESTRDMEVYIASEHSLNAGSSNNTSPSDTVCMVGGFERLCRMVLDKRVLGSVVQICGWASC